MARTPITYAPLSMWPAGRPYTEPGLREPARFQGGGKYQADPLQPGQGTRWVAGKRTPLSRTLEDLDRELTAVSAKDVVVQLDAANKDDFRRELRRDGQVRDDARMKSPAVVVSFLRGADKRPLVFACDFFQRWQDNLRAIALGLESLRRLERYHIAQTGDQYRGWMALPASTMPALSTEQAAGVLARRAPWSAEEIVGDSEIAKRAYRAAAGRTHPDAGGNGTVSDFNLVQEAKRILEAHFGGSL